MPRACWSALFAALREEATVNDEADWVVYPTLRRLRKVSRVTRLLKRPHARSSAVRARSFNTPALDATRSNL